MSRDTLKMLHDAKKHEEPTVDGWPLHSGLPQPKPVAWQVKFRDDDGIPQIAWFPHPVHPESNLAKRPYIEEPLYTAPPSCKTCKRCQTEAS